MCTVRPNTAALCHREISNTLAEWGLSTEKQNSSEKQIYEEKESNNNNNNNDETGVTLHHECHRAHGVSMGKSGFAVEKFIKNGYFVFNVVLHTNDGRITSKDNGHVWEDFALGKTMR